MEPNSKFFIQTFGCRCNQADSAAIRAGLCQNLLTETGSHRDADLVVVNTCTITHRTDQQVRQAIRKVHRENPGARVLVTGCYAERDPEALAAMPGVGLVLGNADKERLGSIFEKEIEVATERIIRTPLEAGHDYLLPVRSLPGGKTRPFVKLQDGCDARCSYCIVPSVRGVGRSARPEDVLSQIRELIVQGYQEIVLTGIHLGTYGRSMGSRVNLVDLLGRILELPGLGRLRLSSIEPMRFGRAIVDLAARNPAFAPHFHIPVQSGSDRILRRMRRPYTASRFRDLIQYIRNKMPGAGLGTDVLIGFPGETEEDFDATCAVVRDSAINYAHVFPFSAREGTAAFSMPDPVSPDVIHKRARIVRDIAQAKNFSFRRGFLGQTLKGITLAKEEVMGESTVLTENYIQVRVPKSEVRANLLVNVRIQDAQPDITHGKIVND